MRKRELRRVQRLAREPQAPPRFGIERVFGEAVVKLLVDPVDLVANERQTHVPGMHADLVLLDDGLRVRASWIAGEAAWFEAAA